MIAVGSENAQEAITKATEVAGDVVERAKSNAKDAFEFVSEKVDDIQQGMKKENVSHTKSLEHDKK
jgi:hypothetical protein